MFLFSSKHCLLSPTFTGNRNIDSAEGRGRWEHQVNITCAGHKFGKVNFGPQPETEQQKCMMELPKPAGSALTSLSHQSSTTQSAPTTQVQEATNSPWRHDVWWHQNSRTPDLVTAEPHLQIIFNNSETFLWPWKHLSLVGISAKSYKRDFVLQSRYWEQWRWTVQQQMRLCSFINWLFALNPGETVQLLTEEKWRTTVLKEY